MNQRPINYRVKVVTRFVHSLAKLAKERAPEESGLSFLKTSHELATGISTSGTSRVFKVPACISVLTADNGRNETPSPSSIRRLVISTWVTTSVRKRGTCWRTAIKMSSQ